uniref:site-specific DNA-methyltransferase (adenine-specific) n=1 Tax=viral metagenome TaxID=1070528 RepID=A0A6C0H3Q1_9ZZZZ
MEYSPLSKELTSKLSKTLKKNGGIYFTPPSIIVENIKLLEPYMNNISNVLEPSCGSCEYINALINNYKHLKITGIELNSTIYESIKDMVSTNVKLYNSDYLKYTSNETYDLIIGNPPYFVMKKEDVAKSYYKYFEGRPNIFILFIIKSITLVKENGLISFILPKNFLNCLYYDKTRSYINAHFQILNIVECVNSKYIETQQATILLIIKKTSYNVINNEDYVLERSNYTLFASKTNCAKLKTLLLNSTSLEALGFKVGIGSVVWNQCKDLLTNDASKTRLIYSSSIENNKLCLQSSNNIEKKNYITKKGIIGPMIVVNRGYGVGNYKFNYCLINENYEYLLENHLITIEFKEAHLEELLNLYKKIITSLEHSNTLAFVAIYFGNNAINSTELSKILPIYYN